MSVRNRSTHQGKLEWKDSYSVGVELLDAQHRQLLDLINQISAFADNASSAATCFALLNAMIKYAQGHFRTEEAYLEKNAYPKCMQQREEHENFVNEAFSMTQSLVEGLLTPGGIKIYLEEWYKDHVLGADQEYKVFFTESSS